MLKSGKTHSHASETEIKRFVYYIIIMMLRAKLKMPQSVWAKLGNNIDLFKNYYLFSQFRDQKKNIQDYTKKIALFTAAFIRQIYLRE